MHMGGGGGQNPHTRTKPGNLPARDRFMDPSPPKWWNVMGLREPEINNTGKKHTEIFNVLCIWYRSLSLKHILS